MYAALANNPVRYSDPSGEEPIDPRTGKPFVMDLWRAAVYDADYLAHTKFRAIKDSTLYAHASPWVKRERCKPDGIYEGATQHIHESNFKYTTAAAKTALGKLFPSHKYPGYDHGAPHDMMWRRVAMKGTYLFLDDRYSESEWLFQNQTEFNIMKVEENYITQIVNLSRPDGDGEFNISTVVDFDIKKGEVQTRTKKNWLGQTKTERYRVLTVTETTQQYENNEARGEATSRTYEREQIVQ